MTMLGGPWEASDVAIEWDRIGQPAFDRHVEALLHRMFDDSGQVVVVNGRGGDNGIDVQVTTDAGLRIFQLKYHPDGFPGSLKGRRASIKKSFNRAMAHEPVEWTLVVPCTLTTSERTFVGKLADNQAAVKVSVLDRSDLDCHFAVHPDLEASFTRDLLREAARDFNQERAMLLGADDLADRVRALGGRADTVDPDWTWDFQRHGDTVIQTLRAKHSRAHEVSPISLRLVGRPEAVSADLTAAITRTLGFGIADDIVLPREAVESLTIDGPSWLSRTVTDVEVLWKPAPASAPAGTRVEVAFLDTGGGVAACYAGRLNTVGSGGLGASVDADVHGARLQMMLPFEDTAAGTLRYSFDLEGREPAEAMKLMRLYQRLLRGGAFRLSVNGVNAGAGMLPPSGSPDHLREVEHLLLYLSDWDVLQQHCENYFPTPLTYTAVERIQVRIARLVVEGHCVAYPFAHTLTITLNGQDHPALHSVLGDRPQCIRVSPPGFEVTVGGHTLDIGPVHLFHTQLSADNGQDALRALTRGQGVGTKVTLRPADDKSYRLYLADAPDDGRPLIPTSLGLDGYTDPK
ncbi:hypothetical protein AB0I54_46945 [Streptomyces sp. NPDC050625]|uniref:hypothetical protein n=1 Tax=Streptomyces sp. NPDC050625 TaxID=3154629 RepID=UPI0034262FB9